MYVFSGVIALLKEYPVCAKDDTLTPEQARILVRIILNVKHNI
jgi:ribosomal protein S15P/S13E